MDPIVTAAAGFVMGWMCAMSAMAIAVYLRARKRFKGEVVSERL